MTGTWDQAEGSKGGGTQSRDTVQRQARSAGRRDKRQRLAVVGVVDVKLGGGLFQERRWVLGARERGYKEECYRSVSGMI